MMRENESDGEGGWTQPPEYVSPWAPRDEAATRARTRGPAGPRRTRLPRRRTAIRTPSPSARRLAHLAATARAPTRSPATEASPAYGQAWYDNQAPDGQTWYGSQDGYGRPGREDSGDPAGHQAGGGYGAAGWAPPDPPPGAVPAAAGASWSIVAVAALAAGIGAGATVALQPPQRGPVGRDLLERGSRAARQRGGQRVLVGSAQTAAAVANKVDPGLVDIISTLKYNSETAEGTGMIISSSGLVLTNNHVIDGATVVQATLVDPGSNSSQSYAAQVVGYDADR